MPSVTIKSIMLTVVMIIVIMLIVIMLNVVAPVAGDKRISLFLII
jgi:hypothetical protein